MGEKVCPTCGGQICGAAEAIGGCPARTAAHRHSAHEERWRVSRITEMALMARKVLSRP